jgi:hypothetical protein
MSEKIENYAQALNDARGDVSRQLEIVDDFVENVMKQGEDYGLIPGIPKPTLFKSGAEKLGALFEVHAVKEVTYRVLDFVDNYEYEAKNGAVKKVKGLAAVEVTCTLYDKQGNRVGSGLGGCSNGEAKFMQHAAAILNNLLKMAGKRAFVDAILTLSLVSGRFTQDMEDADTSDRTSENPDELVIGFGTCKDQAVSAIPDNSVIWYYNAARKSVAEKKFLDTNTPLMKACKAEAEKRGLKIPS